MTRFISFIRHAEAATSFTTKDFDRPLTYLGQKSARKIYSQLYATMPNVLHNPCVFCSTSKRTKETAEILFPSLINTERFQLEKSLYSAELEDIYNLIHSINESFLSIFIIGHNPSIERIVEELNRSLPDEFLTGYPTAGLTVFKTSHSWNEIRPSTVSLVQTFTATI